MYEDEDEVNDLEPERAAPPVVPTSIEAATAEQESESLVPQTSDNPVPVVVDTQVDNVEGTPAVNGSQPQPALL
jgi:hypothetical protein